MYYFEKKNSFSPHENVWGPRKNVSPGLLWLSTGLVRIRVRNRVRRWLNH